MTPLTAAMIELRLAVNKAEGRVRTLLDNQPQTVNDAAAALHDHRVDVAGDLADALDRIDPNLGYRFMQALFPEIDLATEHDLGVLESIGAISTDPQVRL